MGGFKHAIDRYFCITERGSTIGTEVKSGCITFLTASYILLVNPQILGEAGEEAGGGGGGAVRRGGGNRRTRSRRGRLPTLATPRPRPTGLPVKAVVAATALSSLVASLLTGLLSNLPVSVSPGMGLNAFLVFSQVLGMGVSVEKALAGCFIAAVIVAALASVRALHAILSIVPDSIKLAVVSACACAALAGRPPARSPPRPRPPSPLPRHPPSTFPRTQVVGMGLLLTFIGLQSSLVVVADPATMVAMGDLLQLEPMLAIGGLAVIAALHYRNVKGSIVIGIALTAISYYAAKNSWPHE